MNRTLEQWAQVSAKAVSEGSQAQAKNVLQMALDDIAELGRVAKDLAEPHEKVRGQNPVVLYFRTAEDRDAFVAAVHAEHPGMRTIQL